MDQTFEEVKIEYLRAWSKYIDALSQDSSDREERKAAYEAAKKRYTQARGIR